MRQPLILTSALLTTVALTSLVNAATIYVSPAGSATSVCNRDAPCSLTYAANNAKAGDTVVLLDGVYKSQLLVANSGTAAAWITFQADECATPIIEGNGIETATGVDAVDQPTGVGSSTATYLRFIGLVSRGWNTGYGNGWTGSGTTNSNGHFEYKFCISDGNGRTGFTFYSAEGLHIQNCIAAHNGSSAAHSWSSGMTLYEAQGSNNLIEGSVSFENMDAQQHTDGSGFIADETSNDATFLNNIAFRNGGSCLRLTSSSGTKFINNTCYHNAQDPDDTGPTNPGEIYFTNDATRDNVTIKNNTFLSTGSGPGAQAVLGQPSAGWSNNVVQNGGSVSFFKSPDGTNPDFTLAATATALIGKGSAGGDAPTNDIGFDPQCIIKRVPTMFGNYPTASWWQYSIDIEYIKSIGGVAKCFNPKTRSGSPDIGAYVSDAVTTSSGTCTRSTGGTTGTGGATFNAGTDSGGTDPGAGGFTAIIGGASATGGSSASASTGGETNSGAGGAVGNSENPTGSGCSCRMAATPSSRSTALIGFGWLAAGLLLRRRRED